MKQLLIMARDTIRTSGTSPYQTEQMLKESATCAALTAAINDQECSGMFGSQTDAEVSTDVRKSILEEVAERMRVTQGPRSSAEAEVRRMM